MSPGLPRLGEPDCNGAIPVGGSAKEKSSRVWGGSGVGAEVRSELQSVECLQDFGPGGQMLRNVPRIVALDFRI